MRKFLEETEDEDYVIKILPCYIGKRFTDTDDKTSVDSGIFMTIDATSNSVV